MKNRFHYLHPKLALLLSALFLLLSLYLLWADLNFYMPTPNLALRKAAAECALPPDGWQHYIPFKDDSASAPRDSWYFFRRENNFYTFRILQYTGEPLWASPIYPLTPLSPLALDFNPIHDIQEENIVRGGTETVTLVISPDPAVARIALTQYCLPTGWEGSKDDLLSNYSATADCVETAPGSGFWICQQIIPSPPFSVTSWSNNTIVRTYAANGTLLSTSTD